MDGLCFHPAQPKADVTSPESEEALLFRLAEQRTRVGIWASDEVCICQESREVACHSLCEVDCQCDCREVIVRIQLSHGEGREGPSCVQAFPSLLGQNSKHT